MRSSPSPGILTVGTYTGNGTAGRTVTGLGFSPEALFVFDAGNQEAVFTNSAAGGNAFDFNNSTNATWIPSLDANGFTLGADDRVNGSGRTYHYVALNEIPGWMDVGSYTGDGVDNRNITGIGFQPEWVVVKNTAGDGVVQHFDSQGAGTDSSSVFTGKTEATNRIQQLQADGFQAGADNDVNGSGKTYTYMAFSQETQPTISNVTNQSTNEDVPTGAIAFTIGDAETAAGSLTVVASSSNQALVPDANIVLGGSGANRTVTITPAPNQYGSVTITLGVSDGFAAATDTFVLTVNPMTDTPSVTNATTNEDTQTSTGLVITRNAADGAEVTHFQISGISNGTLYQNDGTTLINNGDFITAAQGSAGLKFTPTANFSGSGSFTVQASTSNSVGGLGGSTVNATITVNAVNDAPSATNLSAAETYTEDSALNLTDIVISDVDSASVTATLTLSNTAAGSLNTGTSGAVTSTYNAGTGVWTASGAIANVNALLAGLTFTPAANFNSNFTIATSVSDGVAAPVTGSKAMTGTAVNDAPSATNLSAAETYTEDTALNLTDIVISDVDSANVTATLTLSNTAVGSLNTGTSGAVTSTFNAGTGVWTASGAIANVNALLVGLTFTPAANFNSNFTIATSISDGVAAPVTGSKAMTGTAANDAPSATNLSAAETYTEDTALNLTDIVISDIDSASVTATLTLSNTAAGSLNTGTSGAVTSTYNAGTGVWAASGAIADVNALLAGLTFTPAANFNSNFTIATSVSDGVAAPVTGSKAMTGTPVNDAPVITSNGGGASASISVAENSTAVTTVTSSDVDGGAPVYSILAGADGAKFSVNAGTGVLSFVTAPDYEHPGDLGADNVYNLTLQVSDGSGGTDSQAIAVTVTDVVDGIRVTPISVVPIGGETRVNTNTSDTQSINPNVAQAVATDAAGNFVVVWSSNLQDGSSYGIYAQRFAADGTAQGSDFLVNTTTADDQITPVVAMDAAGNFVVSWSSNLQDGSGHGLYAQRFNAAGIAQGSEFLVNTTTAGSQTTPAIAMSPQRRLCDHLDQQRPGPGCQLGHLRAALRCERRRAGRGVPRQHLHDEYAAVHIGRRWTRQAISS